jgi:hypothetical protein
MWRISLAEMEEKANSSSAWEEMKVSDHYRPEQRCKHAAEVKEGKVHEKRAHLLRDSQTEK